MNQCIKTAVLLSLWVFSMELTQAATNTLVPMGATWKYLDTGSDQGTAWRAPGFNDSSWASGAAQLGYSFPNLEGDEVTVIGFGPDPNNKYPTTYFRTAFQISNLADYTNLTLTLLRDDGGVVYLNGSEIFRSPNMPAGPIVFSTLANNTGENTIDVANVTANLGLLVEGANVLAVEIHQQSPTSSDVSFDLQLVGVNTGAGNIAPTVSLTAPPNNSTFNAPTNVLLQAMASDMDGTVSKVEFFRDGSKVGEDLSGPAFTLDWTNALVGSFQLTAIATDNGGAIGVSAPISVTFTGAAPATLIAAGSVWKYLDTGDNLTGTPWTTLGYDDSAWLAGPAELGYGDAPQRPEATVVNGTYPGGQRIVTTYFRHVFNTPNPAAFSFLLVRLLRDDGGIVYLNGTEIFRSNIGPDPVDYQTLAQLANDDGTVFFTNTAPANLLTPGDNVVAVEIHQSSLNSSDISFDLELIGNTGAIANNPPTVAITSPGSGSAFTEPANITLNANASDSDGNVARVEFFANGAKIGEDTSSPFSFDWNGVLVGSYALRAVATDNLGFSSTSAVVNVTVGVASVPTVAGKIPAPGNVPSLTAITVTFSEPVSGVDASDLLINGVPADAVVGSGADYMFTFHPPAEGAVFVAWNGAHGIADFENPPKPFDPYGAGATWQYTLTDTVAPGIARVSPPAGSTIRELDAIEVTFDEPVIGLNAADLRINGVAATSVSGKDTGPYEFHFAPTANGTVNITWTAGHGITDRAAARNAFVGTPWSYTLNTNAVWVGQVVINEIMYHPAHDQAAFMPEPIHEEYVELFNRGSSAVNLAGWRLNRAIEFVFPNTNLVAGGYLVVAANVAAFRAKYPTVANVVGGWTGRLSNNRDEIELEDASGNRVDLVEYADEGDWAVRTATGLGWEWLSAADGFGSSLELRQGALDNNAGQNWRASVAVNGTPGTANSVVAANLPPMVLDVTHFPAVPRSTNSITILARIVDELTSGLTVRLWRRDASTTTLGAFTSVPMLDNGLNNDGTAGDGLFGVVLPPLANRSITEFYVEATDAASNVRTWPAAADLGGGNFAQEANAFFQVDDEAYAGKQPVYRIILRPGDRNDFFNLRDRIQRNATFITVEGSDVQIRHNCDARRRGQSSFGATPPTMKFNIPTDRVWNNKSSLNLNSVNTYAQVLGNMLALKAGLPAPYCRAVQVRFNGVNEAPSGPGMFGSYAHVEVANGEWARDHLPDDGNGNVYSKRRPECGAFEYLGAAPQGYVNCAYDKESNASENDWTDLMNLTFAMDPDTTPANDYVQAVRRNLNVELALRYFAVLFLMNYTETSIANGADDDYDLYRGIVDPRFLLLAHDFDQIFGSDAGQPSTPNDLFIAGNQPNINRFLRHPEFEPLFYAEYRRQLAAAFSTNTLFPLMDQLLGDWVPDGTLNARKSSALARINFVAGALPAPPVVVLATISGEPDSPSYLSAATLNVGGAGITHYRYRVNNGAWSADQLVSQPINLTSLANGHYTVYVVGRNSSGIWQADGDATISKTWAVLSSLRGVVINEILARNDNAVNHEGTFPDIIEFFNSGTSTMDLSGWRLTDDLDDPNKFTFPAGTTLAAGAYRVVFANNPDGTSGLHTGFGLNQDGDELYLLDRATNGTRVIDSVKFGWQLPNLSAGRLSNGQWGLCAPTAGALNTAVPAGSAATLKINEWLASPASPFVEDFIELYNPDSLPVNLGGLYLTDELLGLPLRHQIAPLSFIEGFGYRVFIADGNKSAGPDHVDFSLASETGAITLLSGAGVVIDCVVYGQQFAGVSQGRTPNGGSRIVYFDVPTPGAGNPAAPPPVQPQTVNLLPINDSFLWKYEDTGADLGTAWRATGYNDSAWPSGAALLAFEDAPLPEPIRTPLARQNGKITFYFRAHFTLPPSLSISALQVTHVIDDGAVFYLNGQEAGRFGMPAGPVDFTTLATPGVGDATYQGPFDLPLSNMVAGDNVIAVEVHQSSAGSSDVVFGLRLDAVILTNNPALAGVRINEILANARDTTNTDGTVSDWVELYNPSNGSIDLSGMSFTDHVADPRRWVFPQGSVVPAMGYRVVRFDSDAPATTNSATVLNTGFGLKASGDSLYLFNRPQSGGELLDAISFGVQAPDWSIGRVPNGSSNWVLNLPTQGFANIAASLGNRAALRINEWMAAPSSGADWFEIYNPNAQPVELSGLHLTDDLNDRLQYPPFPPRTYIAAGLSGFLKIIADNDPTAGADHVPFALSRNGESLGIADGFGTLIDQYTFGAQLTGVSQGRLPDGSTNIVLFAETPSPEESNYLPIPDVVINEALTHSDPPLEDAIELRNTSGSPVNIGGWFMSDARSALKKFRIPTGMTIPANGFLVFYEYQFNPVPGDPGSFSLSSARGDQIYLSVADAAQQLTGYRAVVDFGPAENGVSFGRYVTSDARAEFTALSARTFGVDTPEDVTEFRGGTGRTNAYPRVGPVVISEIMYHPPDLGGNDNVLDEFIELQNFSAFSVPLYDPDYPTNAWKLRDAVSFHFPPVTSIPANGFLIVVSFDPANATQLSAFRSKYNVQAGTPIVGPYSGKLDNSGESVELVKPDPPQTTPGPDFGFVPYVLVDKVRYSDSAPWPSCGPNCGADGGGQSLQRINLNEYGNDPINWQSGSPTPGPQGSSPDSDNDGMLDSWEQQYGLIVGVNDAQGDLDGDGLKNIDEFLAGTLPNDPNSNLRLRVSISNGALLQFNAAAGIAYVIEYKNALAPGAWTFLFNVPAGSARPIQLNDPAPGALRFYRVRTQ